jgi:hypothetical protein
MFDAFTQQLYTRPKDELAETLSILPNGTLKKLAFGEVELGEGPRSWLDRFRGTELFDQALELAQEELEQEAREMQTRQQQSQFFSVSDQIRLKKKMLELELARLQEGGADTPPAPSGPVEQPVPSAAPTGPQGAGAQASITPEPGAPPKTASAEDRLLVLLEGMDKEALGFADVAGFAKRFDPRKLFQTAGGGSVFRNRAANMAALAKKQNLSAGLAAPPTVPTYSYRDMFQQGNPMAGLVGDLRNSLKRRPGLNTMMEQAGVVPTIPKKGLGTMIQEGNPLAGIVGDLRNSLRRRPGLNTMMRSIEAPHGVAPVSSQMAYRVAPTLNQPPAPGALRRVAPTLPNQPLAAAVPRRVAPTLVDVPFDARIHPVPVLGVGGRRSNNTLIGAAPNVIQPSTVRSVGGPHPYSMGRLDEIDAGWSWPGVAAPVYGGMIKQQSAAPVALLREMQKKAGIGTALWDIARRNPGAALGVGGGAILGGVRGAQQKIDPVTGQPVGGGITGAIGGSLLGGATGGLAGLGAQGATRSLWGAHNVMEDYAKKGLRAPGGYWGQVTDQALRRARLFAKDVQGLSKAVGAEAGGAADWLARQRRAQRIARGPATPLPVEAAAAAG